MAQVPYAKLLMRVDGGSLVSGGQVAAGGNAIQLSGENTSQWEQCLYEIYDYPDGFACPAGWTNNGGVYQTNGTAFLPASFTLGAATPLWGKYLFRLTVNQGLLAGVYQGPDATQPLVDEATAIQVYSPRLSLRDVCWQEGKQFDAQRHYVGELKKTLRQIESVSAGGASPGAPDTSVQFNAGGAFAGNANVAILAGFLTLASDLRLVNSSHYAYLDPGTLSADITATMPPTTSVLVGDTCVQTLTTKTINATNNTITDTGIANGDILVATGGKFLRYGVGTNGQALVLAAGVPAWTTLTEREQRASLAKATNYTIVATTDFHVTVTAGSVTITLPAAPADGDMYAIKSGGAFLATIAGNGKNIDGNASYTQLANRECTYVRYSAAGGIAQWEIV